mmetsp:Transcript_16720/g.14635  ORF Transcript_16720/g.14635 Transcript_16720/m.14635 type:complete len:166 (+) Transcript_16720:13-510(+)
MKTAILLLLAVLCLTQIKAQDAGSDEFTNEADELDSIVLHSFEHFDYLDILYKLKGHNSDTWIVLFYIDEDHHKEERDRVKKLIFKENPDFQYAEANISKPNYAPIRQAIRFPQHATSSDFPMVLIMKSQVGQMVYGPGVARKAADVVADMKEKEEAAKAAAENQ